MGISTNTAGRLLIDSSQGIAMMAVKSFEGEFLVTAATVSNLVRLETGSNREAVLARWAMA